MNSTEVLEKYIERDIIEYLDNISKSIQIGDNKSEEYIKEIKQNLEIKDTVTAIKILSKAIQEFNVTNSTDPYKQIRLKHILEISELLKIFCQKNPEATRIKHVTETLLEELELNENEITNLDTFTKLEKEKEQKTREKEEKYYQIKKTLIAHLSEIKKDLSIALLKKDVQTAMKKYKLLKQIFTRYPSIYIDEKKELYNDMISYYMQIKKTMKQLTQNKEDDKKDKIIKDLEIKENYQQLHLENIQEIINSIKQDSKEKEFEKAKNKIIELKHIASQIPDKHKIIKQRLETKIDLINQRIEFIKRFNMQKNKNLLEPNNESTKVQN
ncbi:hypothetical protein K9M18_05190 [Candidatus Woesearchaeota archaeon]|nr:hypothetical protein [Candidatus Woesearchaeota archaeon]MCF8013310.1 hypothetical protein [Candidatus Woesearchaeota archaeon]